MRLIVNILLYTSSGLLIISAIFILMILPYGQPIQLAGLVSGNLGLLVGFVFQARKKTEKRFALLSLIFFGLFYLWFNLFLSEEGVFKLFGQTVVAAIVAIMILLQPFKRWNEAEDLNEKIQGIGKD